MTTQRWVLTEVATGESWTMPINPDSMSSPFPRRDVVHARGQAGRLKRVRTVVLPAAAMEWEWSGVIRTEAHYLDLVKWAKKDGKVRVTDHLNRRFEVMLQAFEPEDRPPTPRTPWRLRYTMRALILRRLP